MFFFQAFSGVLDFLLVPRLNIDNCRDVKLVSTEERHEPRNPINTANRADDPAIVEAGFSSLFQLTGKPLQVKELRRSLNKERVFPDEQGLRYFVVEDPL